MTFPMSKKRLNSLEDLGVLLSDEEKAERAAQTAYQKDWKDNMFRFREMVAKKNKKWLIENSKDVDFEYYKEYPDIYDKIADMFEKENQRKFILHLICNFLPLNNATKAPKNPIGQQKCPLTQFELTDLKSILTGDRDKHLAFTGKNTDKLLSGVAIQELERFVYYCLEAFNTREGQIVNHALDVERTNNKYNDKPKNNTEKKSPT